jgi:predicted secreted hydrolase
MRRGLISLAFITCLLGTVLSSAEQWRRVTGPPDLDLPRDHGSHPDYRTEWWYLTGLVQDSDEQRYGYQLTFFRAGLRPGLPPADVSQLRAHQILAAHMAIAAVDTGDFVAYQRVRRQGAGLAQAREDRLHVWLESWELEQLADGTILASAASPGGRDAFEFRLTPARPLTLHGVRGYSRKGQEGGNASAYLTWTRLATSGELVVAGRKLQVEGETWFDHEWGTSQLGDGVTGWDWFGLRLADGRDLMIYRLRQEDGTPSPWSAGTLVAADGTTTSLEVKDFSLEPGRTWTSPETGGTYPIEWQIVVPRADLELDVRALVPTAEVDTRATTGVVYWEGPVQIRGSVEGEGYAELTGYAHSLEAMF